MSIKSMHSMILTTGTLFFFLLSLNILHAQKRFDYQIEISGQVMSSTPNHEFKLESDIDMTYSRLVEGDRCVWTINELAAKMVYNGETRMDTVMNREEGVDRISKLKVSRGDGTPAAKFLNGFEKPLIETQHEKSGKETKRKQFSNPDVQGLLQSKEYMNAVLFHGPFYADKKNWSSEIEYSFGEGKVLKGSMNYKVVSTKDGIVVVESSAKLNSDKETKAERSENIKSTFTGRHHYSLEQKRWLSGEIKIAQTMDFINQGEKFADGQSRFVLKMKTVKTKEPKKGLEKDRSDDRSKNKRQKKLGENAELIMNGLVGN